MTTPRPWKYQTAKYTSDGELDCGISPIDSPACIAECFGRVGDKRTEDSTANAELIVRCVNSHDALVGALEEAIEHSRTGLESKWMQTLKLAKKSI